MIIEYNFGLLKNQGKTLSCSYLLQPTNLFYFSLFLFFPWVYLWEIKYMCVFLFLVFLHPSYFIFSSFEFSVILYSGARILNTHINTHIYEHKAYHINYHIHHGASSARNVHVLTDTEEIRLKECCAARRIYKGVQPITSTFVLCLTLFSSTIVRDEGEKKIVM